MILVGSARQAEQLVSVCSVNERVEMIWLLQYRAGVAALVFRFNLKVQNSNFRNVGDARDWERDFGEGEEM